MDDQLNRITGRRFTLRQQAFFKTEEAREALEELQRMVDDPAYETNEYYTSNTEEDTPFVDKHMIYLSEHPKLNPQHYLSNLRMKTRIREDNN